MTLFFLWGGHGGRVGSLNSLIIDARGVQKWMWGKNGMLSVEDPGLLR